MKRLFIRICAAALCLLSLPNFVLQVAAKGTEDTEYPDSPLELQYYSYLEEKEAEYLADHGVNDFNSLSPEEINQWLYQIEEIKRDFFGNSISNTTDIVSPNAQVLGDYTGRIFISFDSGISSWQHGHAAIGYGNGTIEILGPGYTVQNYGYTRVMAFYFSHTGGYYAVNNATSTHYNLAAAKAYTLIDTPYITNNILTGITCSTLVSTAWANAGYSLNGLSPHTLAADSHTYMSFAWDGSYGGQTQ